MGTKYNRIHYIPIEYMEENECWVIPPIFPTDNPIEIAKLRVGKVLREAKNRCLVAYKQSQNILYYFPYLNHPSRTVENASITLSRPTRERNNMQDEIHIYRTLFNLRYKKAGDKPTSTKLYMAEALVGDEFVTVYSDPNDRTFDSFRRILQDGYTWKEGALYKAIEDFNRIYRPVSKSTPSERPIYRPNWGTISGGIPVRPSYQATVMDDPFDDGPPDAPAGYHYIRQDNNVYELVEGDAPQQPAEDFIELAGLVPAPIPPGFPEGTRVYAQPNEGEVVITQPLFDDGVLNIEATPEHPSGVLADEGGTYEGLDGVIREGYVPERQDNLARYVDFNIPEEWQPPAQWTSLYAYTYRNEDLHVTPAGQEQRAQDATTEFARHFGMSLEQAAEALERFEEGVAGFFAVDPAVPEVSDDEEE